MKVKTIKKSKHWLYMAINPIFFIQRNAAFSSNFEINISVPLFQPVPSSACFLFKLSCHLSKTFFNNAISCKLWLRSNEQRELIQIWNQVSYHSIFFKIMNLTNE